MAEPIVEIETPAALMRWAREQAGLSQPELGARIGVSYQQVSTWETGRRHPRAEHMISVIHACGFDVVLQPMGDEK